MRGGGEAGEAGGGGVFGGRRLARDATHGAVAQGALDGRASALGVAPRAARPLTSGRFGRRTLAVVRALANPPEHATSRRYAATEYRAAPGGGGGEGE